jgi:hypothetical protein|tara:strand:+ start:1153 stop:1407 length:255 start_codon:yes stop_codon:yes gene_type:complete
MPQITQNGLIQQMTFLMEHTRDAVEDAQMLVGKEREERRNDAVAFAAQLDVYLAYCERFGQPEHVVRHGIIQAEMAHNYLELIK